MIHPPSAPSGCTFAIDQASGDLLITTQAGILIASLPFVDQLKLLHAVTGAHLQEIARADLAAPMQVVRPITSPVD